MNANDRFFARDAHVDDAAVQPLPNSRKIFVEGSRPDIRVPMREIVQSDTPASFGVEANPPIVVYDTSGPYTDPGVRIDVRTGLPPLRAGWIGERGDTVELDGPTSAYGWFRRMCVGRTGCIRRTLRLPSFSRWFSSMPGEPRRSAGWQPSPGPI